MVTFTAPLVVQNLIQDESLWCLVEDLTATVVDEDGTITYLLVPAGFITDFASVPRIPLAYELFGNTAHRPATLHDWLYATANYPREWCDRVFYHAMRIVGISEPKASAMYAAVRQFGESCYHHQMVASALRDGEAQLGDNIA